MPYEIVFTALADEELASIRAFERRRIVDDIEGQLSHEPAVETKRKKRLRAFKAADFEFDPPLWELKVGDYRAFYEVNKESVRVVVRSVRQKLPDQTTEDVLHAKGHP